MSNLKNTYGFSQSLLDAIRSVQENALKGKQRNLDANKNGKIDAEDFKKLRAMKKEEIEQFNEYLSEASPASLASLGNAAQRALDTAHELRRSAGSTLGSTKGFDGHQNKLSDKHIEIAKHHIKALGNAVGAPKTAADTIAHVDKLHAAMKQSQYDRYNDEDFDDDNDPADHHHYNAASGILKLMHKTHNEEADQIDEISRYSDNEETGRDDEKRRMKGPSIPPLRGKPLTRPNLTLPGKPIRKPTFTASYKKEEVEQLEEAQNLIPLISQLKALLSWLVSSGAIRKFAKEEADVVGMLELLEYRTPGSKNGQRKERKSTGAARGRPKNSDSMQSKSNENEELDSAPAYDSASRDTKEGFRHVLTDIQNAADSSTGGTVVQDKQKQRHLPQKTAQQLLNIFRTAKPAVNAELSGHIFANREIPLRSPHHIAAYKAMKGAGEITSLPNGRGRPANEQ